MVSAAPLDDWADCGLPRLKLVQTDSFDEVRAYLAASSVAALPRTVCSGYPIKLLNYLGMGLPTVAARGSAQELPGVVAVPNHDPGAMAAALRSLLEDTPRRRRVGAAARTHVLSACTWDARAGELESVYWKVLDGSKHAERSSQRL